MKKRLLISFCVICISAKTVTSQSVEKYSAKEIKADLEYLRSTMEAAHYDFYALTNKVKMDSVYARTMNSIEDSLTKMQIFRLFQPYVAMSKMSHCSMYWPSNEYGNYIERGGIVFPLNFYFNKNKVLVKANFSGNSLIEKDDEIISLNNEPIDKVLKEIYRYIPGPTNYYKNSQIEQGTFARLYWSFFDKCSIFQITIKKKDGQRIELELNAIPGNEFEEKNREQASLFRPHREFRMIDEVAYLHPGVFINANSNFDMSDPNTVDTKEFHHFIDSTYKMFRLNEAKNLIIDLRYNSGGDNAFSDYMIAYFADKSFSFSSKFSVKTSQITKDFWKKMDAPKHQELKEEILSRENGSFFEVPISKTNPLPDSIRFKGKVYVIINRYSYSNASSAAAIIQDYKFGKVIGEETAEIVSSYGATHKFTLPNTKLGVTYPKAFIIRPSGEGLQRGVIPDYPIDEDIFTETDEVLEYTLNLIRQ